MLLLLVQHSARTPATFGARSNQYTINAQACKKTGLEVHGTPDTLGGADTPIVK